MKELLIMDRVLNTDNLVSLKVEHILPLNDNVIPTSDIVSPQKTTFEILKNKKINIGQLVVIKKGREIEYIGIVQDIASEATTKLSVYPLINITDTDFELKSINGNIYNWITETFTSNFVNRADKDLFMSLPFTFLDYTSGATLTLPLEDGNLFDALLSIFFKTGVYINFSLQYTSGKPESILCEVKRASEATKATIRYDNPIFYEKPIVEFSQAQSVNKLVLKPAEDNITHQDTYTFYLLEDNTITQDSTNEQRLKGVVQKIVSYTDDDYANLQTLAETELVGEAYSHQITLKMLKNEAYDFKLYDRIQYIDEKVLDNKNKIYNTYVTRIEEYENHKVVVLGALRNTLTDKIKALQKTQGSTITSSFSGGGGGGSTIIVEDLLTSTSTTNALSANQGRVLKGFTDKAITQVIQNSQTGIFTFTRNDGTSFTVDTLLEKVVTNFTYNETTQSLELTLEDGTTKSIPMTAFIDDYSGTDGAQITISISNDNKISATIKNGTITKTLLSSDLQTEIDNKAEKSAVESKNTEQDNRLTTLENNKANKTDLNTTNSNVSGLTTRVGNLETNKAGKIELNTKGGMYRGTFGTWDLVPTYVDEYQQDKNGNSTPLENDYIVINNGTGKLDDSSFLFLSDTSGGKASIANTYNGVTESVVYYNATGVNNAKTLNNVVSVYYNSNTGKWVVTTLLDCVFNDINYSANDIIAEWGYSSYKEGYIKYSSNANNGGILIYKGEWGTNGKDGWTGIASMTSMASDIIAKNTEQDNRLKTLENDIKATITDVSINGTTGIFTFTKKDGTTFTVDTLLEKVVTNFRYDETTKELILTLEDGTEQKIPMTAFIDDYIGVDGDVITITISSDNKISATIKNGTITLDKLTTELQNTINNKVDKIYGKGLSTEDYTTTEKNKLAGIDNNANNYTLPQATESVLGGVKAVPKDLSHRRKVAIAGDGTLFSEQVFSNTGTVVWKDGKDLLDWDSNTKVDVRYDMGEIQTGVTTNSRIIFWGGAYGNGTFVIAGRDDSYSLPYPLAIVSNDGVNWSTKRIDISPRPDGYPKSVNGIAFGKGVFVGVLPGSTSYIVYSQDGQTWSLATTTSSWLMNVNYTNGKFLAISNTSIVLISDDGINWQEQDIGINLESDTIAFGNGLYVTENGSYSEDGINWTLGTLTGCDQIVYGNGTFVIVGHNLPEAGDYIYVSEDGKNWDAVETNTAITAFNVPRIAFGDGIFVIVADDWNGVSPLGTKAIYSKNGRDWFDIGSIYAEDGNPKYGVPYLVFGNHRFVCATNNSWNTIIHYIDTLPSVPIARIILPDGTIIETNNIATKDDLGGNGTPIVVDESSDPTDTNVRNSDIAVSIDGFVIEDGARLKLKITNDINAPHNIYTLSINGGDAIRIMPANELSSSNTYFYTSLSAGLYDMYYNASKNWWVITFGTTQGITYTNSGKIYMYIGTNSLTSYQPSSQNPIYLRDYVVDLYCDQNINGVKNFKGSLQKNGVDVAVPNVDNNFTTNQTVNGLVTATAFNAQSDRRLKTNIKKYKCKKSILDLPVKEFDYKSNGQHTIGCIAQDLQKICPEIVNIDKDGYLSIQESKLVYLLLQEVKQLKAEIDKLKEV